MLKKDCLLVFALILTLMGVSFASAHCYPFDYGKSAKYSYNLSSLINYNHATEKYEINASLSMASQPAATGWCIGKISECCSGGYDASARICYTGIPEVSAPWNIACCNYGANCPIVESLHPGQETAYCRQSCNQYIPGKFPGIVGSYNFITYNTGTLNSKYSWVPNDGTVHSVPPKVGDVWVENKAFEVSDMDGMVITGLWGIGSFKPSSVGYRSVPIFEKLPDCEYNPETKQFSGECCEDSRVTGINCGPIACSTDSDCGGNFCLLDNNYCGGTSNLDIFTQEITFTCHNKGTSDSYCTNSTSSLLIGGCLFGCSQGECIGA